MSAVDTKAEFYSDVDDWWSPLFALRIGANPPSIRIKLKFISFVEERCDDVGCWKINDDNLSLLFSEFIDRLGEW